MITVVTSVDIEQHLKLLKILTEYFIWDVRVAEMCNQLQQQLIFSKKQKQPMLKHPGLTDVLL